MLGFCGCWLDGRNGWAHRPTLGLDGLFSLFLSVMVVAFPFYSVCVCVCVTLTLFVLFASVFALLSALSLSLYSFFSVSIFRLRSLNSASYSAQFIAGPSPFSTCIDSPPLLFDVVLSSYPFIPSLIAELPHTVHTCLVSRCNICIS